MLNYIAKEILDKFEKEKGPQKIEEEESKIIKEKVQIKNKINLIQNQTVNLHDEKGKEDFKFCQKRKTIIIKKIFKIENDFLKTKKKSLEEIEINKKQEDISSSLEEFYYHLIEMENKMFDFNDKVNFYSAINIYLKGEKSQFMDAKYKDFKRKPKESEIKDKIKNLLEESSMCKPMNEINEHLNKINDLIDKNIEDIKAFQSDAIDLIEDYGEFFDLNLIIEEFDLSSSFLYYEEFLEFFLKIKEKIHQYDIQKTFLLNEAKNNLIKESMKKLELSSLDEKLIDNIWENLKSESNFIENSIVNTEIKSYVNKNDITIFMQELSSLCSQLIKNINLKEPYPQNIFLKPFMKQNNLYYEIK